MSFVDKEINDKDIIKNSTNFSDEEIKILDTLNLSSNDSKNKLNELQIKEKENKISSNEENSKIDLDVDIKKNNKYIKKYKSNDSRLYGITFQSSKENNIINVAVSSLNMNTNNNISILSFSEEDLINENNEEDNINIINDIISINNINSVNNNSIFLKSQVQCDFPVSSIMFSPHEQNKNLLVSTSDILRLYSYDNENYH